MKPTTDWKRAPWLALWASALLGGAFLPGCLQTSTLDCIGGTTECNVTCVFLADDPANCGACGLACQPGAVCIPPDGGTLGVCQCPATQLLCDGKCSNINTDPNNCGACASAGGAVCETGQVCAPQPDGGAACQTSCGTAVECNGGCVNLGTDPSNCGACGNICAQGYSCHPTPQGNTVGTCLPDVVVACISSSSTVVPVFDSPVQPVVGPGVVLLNPVPGSLGILGDGLLVATEGPLTELILENLALASPELPPLASQGPDYVEVDTRSDAGSWVYVVDGVGNTLAVLTGPPAASAQMLLPDGGVQGLGLLQDGGYIFGPNADPQPYARVGNEIFVPLYGGFPPGNVGTPGGMPGGGTVVRLDVSNPSVPTFVGSYDLNGVPLQSFDGGPTIPRPNQALFHNGLVYVVLNNLDANYNAGGPSVLVEIDPLQPPDGGQGGIAQVVTLDAGVCLDAVSMAENVGGLLVSCFGQAQFDSSFNTVAVDRSGVLSLDNTDTLLSSYSPQCPDAGPACTPPIAGAMALVNGRVYVGDQSSGRVFVVSVGAQGALTELVGYGPDGGVPLQPCPTGLSSVSAILQVP
jgi:hypothetical protein